MSNINLALNKTAAASSYILPFSPSRAVNGTTAATSRWLCSVLPGWLSVDLSAPSWISRWVVRNMSVAGWNAPSYTMGTFKLQGSNDNANWFDLDSVSGANVPVVDRTIIPVKARFFRVYVTNGLQINPKLASITELELYQADPTSPYLSNLTLSAGVLNPVFSRTINTYTASVGYDTSSITVTPTAEDTKATIKVNGTIVASGAASQPLALAVGNNAITVQVTSAVGDLIQLYTITVTRGSNSYLSNLTLNNNGQLNASFSSGIFQYTSGVGYDISSIAVTPTAADPSASIKVNGATVVSGQQSAAINLSDGQTTTISIEVTATVGGEKHTYTVSVTRASSPYLSNLGFSANKGCKLAPAFTTPNLSYTASGVIANTVTVTPTSEGGAIFVNDAPVTSGSPCGVPVTTSPQTINIKVTSAIGVDQKIYTIVLTRA